eukprot:gene26192-biopygen14775
MGLGPQKRGRQLRFQLDSGRERDMSSSENGHCYGGIDVCLDLAQYLPTNTNWQYPLFCARNSAGIILFLEDHCHFYPSSPTRASITCSGTVPEHHLCVPLFKKVESKMSEQS